MRTKAINQFKAIPHVTGLNLIVVATGLQNSVATTTTSPVPIVDSAGVVDAVSVADPDLVEEVEADLKATGPLPSIEEKLLWWLWSGQVSARLRFHVCTRLFRARKCASISLPNS